MAFKDGASKAKPVLLEPIMSVEVQALSNLAFAILNDDPELLELVDPV